MNIMKLVASMIYRQCVNLNRQCVNLDRQRVNLDTNKNDDLFLFKTEMTYFLTNQNRHDILFYPIKTDDILLNQSDCLQ